MSKFNIIYTSPAKDKYLWNGTGFDKLRGRDTAGLMFSGKTYTDEDLSTVLPQCQEVIRKIFPNDNSPRLNPVVITVGPNKNS